MISVNIIPNTYIRGQVPLLSEHFNCFFDSNKKDCDFVIVNNTIPDWVNPKKCILQMTEPPLFPHWEKNYLIKSEFHTVFTHNPCGVNEFPFNPTPLNYPFSIGSKEITRPDTTIKTRSIFYSGMRGDDSYPKIDSKIDAIDIRNLRRDTVEWFLSNYNTIYPYGKGWKLNTRNSKIGWAEQKYIDIENNHCDFILTMENMIMPRYITEKILHGFMLDRVVLYLGESNVTNYIPDNCFIDLRKFYHNGKLDYGSISNLLTNMDQKTYDEILNNARVFRKTILKNYGIADRELTNIMINRIKNNK